MILPSLLELNAELAKRKHIEFMKYTWFYAEPLKIGIHTKTTCERIDQAIEDFRNGISTYLIITMPPRHGKSDMVSRFLPPRFLGLFPYSEIMLCSYSCDLPYEMSTDIKGIMNDDAYKAIFPDIKLHPKKQSIKSWRLDNNIGKFNASGLISGITGKGYHFGVVDDFLSGRDAAESLVVRDKIWGNFTQNFLSRRAPVSITIIIATLWHIDDIVGRIQREMKQDPDYPRFELIKFPAKSSNYKTGYLFPERFLPDYYEMNFKVFGTYGASALMQCEPIPQAGNLLKTNKIKYIDKMPTGLKRVRAWDLASSIQERLKENPDYTVGILMSVLTQNTLYKGLKLYTIYIEDIIRGRWEAPERDKRIIQAAYNDGPSVKIAIEAVGPYKDAYINLKKVLKGIRSVKRIITTTDKVARASQLEAIFEAGNVILLKAPWNDDFTTEVSQFPGALHDDQVDALVTGYEAVKKREGGDSYG